MASGRFIPLVAALLSLMTATVGRAQPLAESAVAATPTKVATRLDAAQHAFYNARYTEAADLALAARSEADDLAALEVRTSALLFHIKRLIGTPPDRRRALAQCSACPALMTAFTADFEHGRTVARARLAARPDDEEALFYLGKLTLNYVWLQLGPLGRKTGWHEYWEARRTLDTLLARNPTHIRGRVARAWIDYIVDTKMPRGTRWVLGGGNRRRALSTVREAADADTDLFTHAEAAFALWEMEIRERHVPAALDVAGALTRDFPDNRELADFVQHRGLQVAAKRD